MLIGYKLGQGSIILRIKIRNGTSTVGAGLTGLTSASAGLIIAVAADNEATTTAYTQAGSTIESITTLGTYAAPTATKCRFKEYDATNHKGIYEIQIADARFAVSSAKFVMISISGAALNIVETDALIPLTSFDPYDGVRGALTALPNAAAGANTGLPVVGTQVPNATAGASGGLLISGSNAGTTTFGAFTITGAMSINGTGNVAQSGDSYARLGAPSGVSISADIAANATLIAAVPAASASAVFAFVVDGTYTFAQVTRLQNSSMVALLSGAVAGGAGTVTVKSLDNSKTRFTWDYDANGNRTALGSINVTI